MIYGKKVLRLKSQHETRKKPAIYGCIEGLYCMLIEAANTIKNYEEMINFSKKRLIFYSKRQTENSTMLESYTCLIEAYCKNGNYKTALETFDKIKLFNLNSMDPYDVDIKDLPQRAFYELVYDYDPKNEFCGKQDDCDCLRKNTESYELTKTLLKIGELCLWKGIAIKKVQNDDYKARYWCCRSGITFSDILSKLIRALTRELIDEFCAIMAFNCIFFTEVKENEEANALQKFEILITLVTNKIRKDKGILPLQKAFHDQNMSVERILPFFKHVEKSKKCSANERKRIFMYKNSLQISQHFQNMLFSKSEEK